MSATLGLGTADLVDHIIVTVGGVAALAGGLLARKHAKVARDSIGVPNGNGTVVEMAETLLARQESYAAERRQWESQHEAVDNTRFGEHGERLERIEVAVTGIAHPVASAPDPPK